MMTATEAIRKLKEKNQFTDEQAESIVDVIEVWHAERAVTRDYLDNRLAELRAWTEGKLRGLLVQIGGLILVATIIQHYWK